MRILFVFLLVAFASTVSVAQSQEITITFTNVKKAKGHIMLSLQASDSSQVDGRKIAIAQTGSFSYKLTIPKPGKYAIQLFHDVNDDEELNTNMLGIPNEPYGFSNNAAATFGPPSLDEQLFSVPPTTKLTIALQ